MKRMKMLLALLCILALGCMGAQAETSGDTLIQEEKAAQYKFNRRVVAGNQVYEVYSGSGTWDEAAAFARKQGGYLACITTAAEQTTVASLVSAYGQACWLGGYLQEDWKWVSGEAFEYTHWDSGEPSGYIDDRAEYYLGIYGNSTQTQWATNKMWNDFSANTSTVKGLVVEYGGITEWTAENWTKYMVLVTDASGKPVFDAKVTFDGDSVYTGYDGTALFGSFTAGETVLTVEKDGYMTWSNEGSNWTKSDSHFETIVLFPASSSRLLLKSAQYSNFSSMSKATNLLTETKKVSLGNDAFLTGDLDFGTFYVSCAAYDATLVKSYQLWQGAKMIAETSDGFFKLNTDSFSKGNDCFIRTVGLAGDHVDTRINLTLVNTPVVERTSLSFSGEALSFKVADNVPFLGGSTFDFNLPVDLPLNVFFDGEKIQIGINAKLNKEDDDKKNEDDEGLEIIDKKKWEKLKELCSDLKKVHSLGLGAMTPAQAEDYVSLVKDKKRWTFLGDGEIDFLGYIEGDIGSKTLSGMISVHGSIKAFQFEYNAWMTVPVTVQVELTGEGTLAGKISYNIKANTLDGNVTFTPSGTLKAFGGMGVSKLVGVGAYGSAKLEMETEILPKPSVNSVDLTGELGIKAYLGWLTYEKPFAYNTWHLYTKNTTKVAQVLKSMGVETEGMSGDDMLRVLYKQISQGIYDASQYKQADLSYLQEEVDCMGGAEAEGPQITEKDENLRAAFTTLIQNTYRNAQPVMVSSGDALYAAFLRADAATGRVYTVVSKFDGKEWKTAVAAASGNILDNAPNLLADGKGNIYLAYARTGAGYDGASLLSYAANQTIVVGRVHPDTLAFTPMKEYTGDGYVHMHKLTLVGGVPTLVWMDSAVSDDNSVLWPEKNDIYSAALDGDGWVEPDLVQSLDNAVFELAVGEEDGRLTVAYIRDEDNRYDTTGDQNLYIISQGSATMAASGCTGKVSFSTLPGMEKSAFIWNEGDTLRTSQGDTITISGLSGEYSVIGDSVYFSTATENGAELTVAKYENGKWSMPMILTEGEGYLENLCVVTLNGVDYALGLYTSVNVGEETIDDSKNLVWTQVTTVSDLRLERADYDPEGLAAGDDVDITLLVRNAGDHTVETIDVLLDGEKLITREVSLAPGEKLELTAVLECPAELTAFTFAVAETGRTDYHPADNEAVVRIGYADLCVTLQSQQIGGTATVYAVVTNEGVGPGSGKLQILNEAGKVLGEKNITNLPAGATTIAMCGFDWSSTQAASADVTAQILCEDDLYAHNNTDTINLTYTGYRKNMSPDVVLPAALLTIEEEAFAGSSVTSVRVAEGTVSIGSRAFADCDDLEQIELPASVTSIAPDAFEGTGGFVIYCPENSEAQRFAAEAGIVCIAE